MGKNQRERPGADLSALLLRGAIGPMMILHGTNKVRGPGGLAGTTRYFESLGLQPAGVHARVAAATEIGTGALLTLGALTPWAAAGVIGVMTSAAATDHKGKGFFIFKGGWEYVGLVGAAAAALSALGPGRFSVDRLRGRDRGGPSRAVFSSALGVGSAIGVLTIGRRPIEPDHGSAASTEATGSASSSAAAAGSAASASAAAAGTPARVAEADASVGSASEAAGTAAEAAGIVAPATETAASAGTAG